MTITQYLSAHRLITDGAFGTYYAELYHTQEMPELANSAHPERVLRIHTDYIEAGARLLRTNTFASNTVLLHADIATVQANIAAAIALAAKAAAGREDVFLAGDIGPIPSDEIMSREELEEQYYQLALTFIQNGVQILSFETFYSLEHILPAIRRIKEEKPDVFIMAAFAVNQFGYSSAGLSARTLLESAADCPQIDACGLNCGIGPAHMEQLLMKAMPQNGAAKYRIALPNAGYPRRTGSTLRYSNSADYFALKMAEMAGRCELDVLGGCCGTTPAFISAIAAHTDLAPAVHKPCAKAQQGTAPAAVKRGFLYEADGTPKQHKLIAVELAPPFGADDKKLLEAARYLQKHKVDVLTFPDSPSGRTRIDSVLMAQKVYHETGMAVMPHICCRDKNAIAMRSLFLGAHINEITNFLIVTGDPVPTTVRQTIKAVFNFDSVGLMQIAKDMNTENFAEAPICYGGAINQNRRNLDVETARVSKKMQAGAEFFLTQPIFSKEAAARIRSIKEQTGARILCGIMPFVSRRNALFMKNEMTGIEVPDEIIARYPEDAKREEGEAVGAAIAREMMALTADFADGYYFSFPFNRVHLIEEVL